MALQNFAYLVLPAPATAAVLPTYTARRLQRYCAAAQSIEVGLGKAHSLPGNSHAYMCFTEEWCLECSYTASTIGYRTWKVIPSRACHVALGWTH
jgi:hypothetical protein